MVKKYINKKKSEGFSPAFYKFLMIAATLIWGLSYVMMKNAVDVLSPAYLIGIRFLATAVVLLIVLWKPVKNNHSKSDILVGSILGFELAAAFVVQTYGLAFTTPGKNAFLTGTYCILVPFVAWAIMRHRPNIYHVIAAVLCFVGIGFVSLQESFVVETGDFLTIISAAIFALQMVCVARFAVGKNILALTVYQFMSGGACSLLLGFLVEPMPALASFSTSFWLDMAYLVLCASAMALLFQNLALAHLPSVQVALLASLEAVFGVVFSIMLYGESMTFKLLIGFVLIFASILISETFPLKVSPLKMPAFLRSEKSFEEELDY